MDWALSRDRYWGTPLPVWVCDGDPAHVEVIGSYQQLAQRWGRPLPPDFDPHKPYIDAYRWRCACGGEMLRAPEVIDTWFDSGSMPYAQWHYPFEHEAEFTAHFPADYICEGVDQTRGWFYSLLAIATAAFDSPAYRNVIVNELVLDSEGQKMSKTKGNVVDPWDMVREFGADLVRLYLLASSQVWLPKRFDRRGIPESAGGFLNTLRNSYTFFAAYSGSWTPGSAPGRGHPGRPLGALSPRRGYRGGHGRLGAVRRHRRSPGADGFRGRRSLQLVRAGQPVPILGPRSRGRSGRRGHAARGPRDGEPPARAGGAVPGRLASPRPRGNLGAPRGVPGQRGQA